jgi:hypothetical protein
MSAATLGDTSSGTPETLRTVGFVGSACSSARFEPAVPYSFSVDSASAVAGLVTNAVIWVCAFSAPALAASKASRSLQGAARPGVTGCQRPAPRGAFGGGGVDLAAQIPH